MPITKRTSNAGTSKTKIRITGTIDMGSSPIEGALSVLRFHFLQNQCHDENNGGDDD